MADLISLSDVPVIPASILPVYSGSSAPLASTAAGIRAILRRTRSMSCHGDPQYYTNATTAYQPEHIDEPTRGRTTSRIAANSKRRRSTATAPILRSTVDCLRTSPPSPYSDSAKLPFGQLPGCLPLSISQSRSLSRTTSDSESSLNGPTWTQNAIPCTSHVEQGKDCQDDNPRNIPRARQYTEDGGGDTSPGQSKSSSPDKPTRFANSVSSRKRKRGFRLRNHRKPEVFRFPQSKSQPESVWPMGDGFSDAEAAPNFLFLMTGKHKHRRPRLPHTVGQLSVEAEKVGRDSSESTFGQPYLSQLRGPQEKFRHLEAKELWPTRENFVDSSAVTEPQVVMEVCSSIQPSPLPCLKSTQGIQQAVQKKRLGSDFENFGMHKRISHSDRGEYSFSSFAGVFEENEHRSGCDEEEDGLNEQTEYEADDSFDYIPATVYGSEGSDSGSQRLSECDSDKQSTMSLVLGS